jgi:hypothetical protein
LLVDPGEVIGAYRHQSAEAIFKIISECGRKINGLKMKTCPLNNNAKKTVERNLKRDALEQLKKLNPSDATILSVLMQCFGGEEDKFEFTKYSMLTLNLLFISNKIQILKCFKKNNMDLDEVLVKIKDNYDYDLFGDKYQKVKRNELNV